MSYTSLFQTIRTWYILFLCEKCIRKKLREGPKPEMQECKSKVPYLTHKSVNDLYFSILNQTNLVLSLHFCITY